MNLFEVYKLWDIEPVRGLDTKLWDKDGAEYTDLYGGHAVISVGHCHPHYVRMISEQLGKLGFYSNAVQNSLQRDLATRLGRVCGYVDYSLFLCNSGAEANENALKVASFHTGKAKVLAFRKAFHGRTSGAVAATDNPKIQSPFNETANIVFVPLNDLEAVDNELSKGGFAAVIIEGIQGVAGIYEPTCEFINGLRTLCDKYGCLLILDEIQSGYGRTGKFFAHQHHGVRADIITMAKGMANGFPIGGVLISPSIKPVHGMLGTTFGGNHLACTAALAVLDIIENENLIEDDAIASLVMTLVELFNQAKVLGFTAEKIDLLVDRIKSDLLPAILRDTFASWPSYWAMVTEGNLEKAIDFIYDGCKDEYAVMISKIREYYNTVQVNHTATLKEMMGKGVRYNVFVK